MAAFLRAIGIDMRAGSVEQPTLFPGSLVSRGSLVIDESKLIAPGDALHEAAHIALAPPERRAHDVAFLDEATGGEELTTIAWCWAALLKLEIAPEEIFHGTAYKGGDSEMIIAAAGRGVYIGFPLLQTWQMAFDKENAVCRGVEPFPHMVKSPKFGDGSRGGATPSASLSLLNDVPHRLRRDASHPTPRRSRAPSSNLGDGVLSRST